MTRLVWRDEQRLLNLSKVVSYSVGEWSARCGIALGQIGK